ncbi:MAG: TetR/AcrR family transcriptional regulator [Acidimicrobiales bacterium]
MAEADQDPATGRGPRAGRADRRRAQVLEAAVGVILERGAHATRYSDIAEASGVPIGTLQHYFGSRHQLLLAAFHHGTAADRDSVRAHLETLPGPWDRLAAVVDAQICAYDTTGSPSSLLYAEFFALALRDPAVRANVIADYQSWRDLVGGIVAEGVREGAFDPSIDPKRVALQVLSLLDGLVTPLALSDPSLPTARARDVALSTLADLVGTGPGTPGPAD